MLMKIQLNLQSPASMEIRKAAACSKSRGPFEYVICKGASVESIDREGQALSPDAAASIPDVIDI
jgi:hypothetical protein